MSSWLASFVVVVVVAVSGCASFYPVETTPEGITRAIEPGDTVRVTTREHGELRLLITAIDEYEIRGRVDGNADDVLWIPFDRIESIEIERLNMKKALLTVVVPVVIAAIVFCNNDECFTQGVVDASF